MESLNTWVHHKTGLGIMCISGIILYLELALIRFLPGHILYLGFFTNFVLLSSFLGIGSGFLLGKLKISLLPFFGPALLLLVVLANVFNSGLNVVNNEVIYFRTDETVQSQGLPIFVILPILFIVIAFVFVCLSQTLAKLFIYQKDPIRAYIFDITGSIIGIVVFSILSYLMTPPPVWFVIVMIFLLSLIRWRKIMLVIFTIIIFIFITYLAVDRSDGVTFWSPYQKVSLIFDPDTQSGTILTNNILHQVFSKLDYAPIYSIIYTRLQKLTPLSNVLIIGAGSGEDVSAALKLGAKHIDAVDIEPKILQIGQQYNPERPYDDPRVTMYNTDGRNFLHNSTAHYDLIVFALTDSLILNSGISQVRLESYLFTLESFQEAKEHLKPHGLFVMYNNYRKEWLIQRLNSMLVRTFHKSPLVSSFTKTSRIFIANATLRPHDRRIIRSTRQSEVLPTDDWPFIYLLEKRIPTFYISVLSLIFIISITVVLFFLKITKSLNLKKANYPRIAIFFLLGMAFSLIETKSIVQFSLLFGTTWFVNTVVFIGILLSVLVACLYNLRFKTNSFKLITVLLVICLVLQYFFPVHTLLHFSYIFRLVTATVLSFLPIFFANLLFVNLFRKSQSVEIDFGSNVLGLVFGGILEYISLITGYSFLAILAIIIYGCAFIIDRLFIRSES